MTSEFEGRQAAIPSVSPSVSAIEGTEVKIANISDDGAPPPIPPSPQGPVPVGSISHRRSLWPVRVPAVLTAIMGIVNLCSTVTPGLNERMLILREMLPLEARRGSHLTAALAGFALILLSVSLWRRKQVAWGLALAVLLISAIAHLLKGLDYEEATGALALATWLWMARRHFHARSDAPSVRQGVRVLLAALVFTLVYGTVGFFLLDEHFKVHFSWRAAALQTLTMFTQFSDPHFEPLTRFGLYFADSIYLVAAATIGYAIFMLARPVVRKQLATPAEYARAKEIVENHGRTALAFCALFDDKIYWFSPGGSVVAYALVGRIAVAIGDPIGPIDDAGAAVRGFVAFCEENDWRAAFYEVYDDLLTHYRDSGLNVLRIAHEAVLNVQKFSLAGKSGKGMRSTINAPLNLGHTARFHEAPLPDAFLAELREVSDEWLTMMHGSEKAFSLGWFDDDYIRACPIMAIHDPDGNVTAFANIVSCFQLNETTVDLMRRRAQTTRGTMELLFVSLFEWAKAQGYDTFNIGPSPFAMVGEHSEDPATEKAIHFIYEHINQFYNFKGLHAFKEKFHPDWRPIYLTYAGKGGLPAVAAAIIRADSGQDTWWDFLRHLRGDRSGGADATEVITQVQATEA